MVTELRYGNTNCFLVKGAGTAGSTGAAANAGALLIDTGWAGTLPLFFGALREAGADVRDIGYLMVTHFHPDHCGIAQEIANLGVKIVVFDVQLDFVHSADAVFAKDKKSRFVPIVDTDICVVPVAESRAFLRSIGIDGEVFHTPGHSDDSVSLWLDEGALFVGDLNPLYELPLHEGTEIGRSWERLLALHPRKVYYGHARACEIGENWQASVTDDEGAASAAANTEQTDRRTTPVPNASADNADRLHPLVQAVINGIDKGYTLDRICRKTGAEREWVENVARMYLTHQNIGVQGILDRIELRAKETKRH
ncbi:MAG: MBL fold metallo-hydrolase [Lachnospiraceae bacterium]|nr:MBL fold metallo-hydrolase [Lachnospiraceae bacterium]